MARQPAADVAIDAALVRALLSEQHPDLDAPVRRVAAGWDNEMWRLGELAVRLPRRALAARLIEHEVAALPAIAPRLPVAVPAPVRVGAPGQGYPWAWTVVPWLPGVPVTGVPVTARRGWAGEFGATLAALHTPAPSDAPVNPVRGGPLHGRAASARERLSGVPDGAALWQVVEDGLAAEPYAGPPVRVHGDPHPANLLADGAALAAVVDWGDVCSGDPASDLATAWMTFDAVGREVFLDAYGNHDAGLWRRARGWAAHMAGIFLSFSDDRPDLAAIGRHTAGQLLGA